MEVVQKAIDEFLWNTVDTFKSLVVVKKGMNNLTEMYSAVEAEVPLNSDPQTSTNTQLIAHLKKARKVFQNLLKYIHIRSSF